MNLYKRIVKVCLLLLFLHISTTGAGQTYNGREPRGGISFAGKTGISILITEIYSDFSGNVNEFDNQPGPYAGIEMTRFFSSAIEAGAGFSYSHLNGQTDNLNFSAVGIHYTMRNPLTGPVSYSNRLYGPELFARYYFGTKVQRPGGMNFFVKAGAGVLFYDSELYYQDRSEDEIIFGKGKGSQKTTKVSNMVYIVGWGVNYALSDRVNLKMAANFNMVGYDFLDVVHNFREDGSRREIIGLVSDFTAGISINLKKTAAAANFNSRKSTRSVNLPFSPGN